MIEDITQARKILFVTPSLRLRDGITANSLNLMRGWLESGFEVLVLNPSKFGMEVEGLFSSSQSFVAYLEGESAFSNITESEYVADTAVIQYAISAYWLRTYWIHRWLKLTSVKSVVLCCHEPIREIKLLKGLGKRIYASAFKNCYKIVLFSAHACELVKTLTDKEVEVYSLPVPKRGVSQGSQSAHPHFLMLGYYLRDKGFEMGLESFIAALRVTKSSIILSVIVSVRERVGSARIFSCRDRRDFEEFQDQLTQAQNYFPANINVFGYLTEAEMESVISKSDYLLMPYVQITNSGVAVTAKAHGIPVISSDLKPLIEAFGDSAFFFSAGSSLDLQERLESIISDPNWKIEREKRARQMVELAALNSAFDVAVDMVDIRFS
jgi:glycosyltransferase involved in cell wall biosynthesis